MTKFETINTIETDTKLLTPEPLPPKTIKNSKRASFIRKCQNEATNVRRVSIEPQIRPISKVFSARRASEAILKPEPLTESNLKKMEENI